MNSRRRVNSTVGRLTNMSSLTIRRSLVGAVLLFLTLHSIAGQIRDDRVFKPIPAELRTTLISRLNLLLEYDRTNQSEKLFELLSTDWLSRVGVPSDRDGYVAFKQKLTSKAGGYNLLSFRPTSVSKTNSKDIGVYIIRGVAKLQPRGTNRTVYEDYFIEAHWQNCQWYFSEPFTFIE